jgi:hypothetical protein
MSTPPLSSAPAAPGTTFPSIEKLRHLISNLEHRIGDKQPYIPPIPLLGTTKLHGAHVDVIISPDSSIRLQSRNLPSLTPTSDVHGFAQWMTTKTPTILSLVPLYHNRFSSLNPSTPISESHPLILACEFIGCGIQKGVAISSLSPSLVILTASLNDRWLPQEAYSDIAVEEEGIYNVIRGGLWHVDLDLSDPTKAEEEIKTLVKAVEKQCPFGATFDAKGAGEGIVWAVADTELFNGPKYWCKTKGGKFAVQTQRVDKGKQLNSKEKVAAFAEGVVTVPRLEQGWAYLEEMGIVRDMASVEVFAEWLVDDCLKEEREEIKEQDLDQKALRWAIVGKARAWYKDRLKGE